ncbi:MAG: hypothetical protein D3922_03035 [Candidatus Electrothrix sp. AR1]|nr:hypothetical protein [Candidatus Electrothrix sp. AR1]
MLSDVFYTRYPQQHYRADGVSQPIQAFFTQVGHVIFEDLCEELDLPRDIFTRAHRKLAREIGLGGLGPGKTDDEICGRLLFERYDLWDNRHGSTDHFIKVRISIIKLIFRELEKHVATLNQTSKSQFFNNRKGVPVEQYRESLSRATNEMNSRFSLAGFPLNYHNGYIQFKDEDIATQAVEDGFWDLLKEQKWKNVDNDIKESIDLRDNNKKDSSFYAFKALESTIKIISNEKGFSTGKERGAANYIDNLVSKKNGRFLEVWEGNILKILFSNIRNPHGHGAGSDPVPQLESYQIDHSIEMVMSWIKSLLKRI